MKIISFILFRIDRTHKRMREREGETQKQMGRMEWNLDTQLRCCEKISKFMRAVASVFVMWNLMWMDLISCCNLNLMRHKVVDVDVDFSLQFKHSNKIGKFCINIFSFVRFRFFFLHSLVYPVKHTYKHPAHSRVGVAGLLSRHYSLYNRRIMTNQSTENRIVQSSKSNIYFIDWKPCTEENLFHFFFHLFALGSCERSSLFVARAFLLLLSQLHFIFSSLRTHLVCTQCEASCLKGSQEHRVRGLPWAVFEFSAILCAVHCDDYRPKC